MTDIIFILAGIFVPIFILVVAVVWEHEDIKFYQRRIDNERQRAEFLFKAYLKSIGCEPKES